MLMMLQEVKKQRSEETRAFLALVADVRVISWNCVTAFAINKIEMQ